MQGLQRNVIGMAFCCKKSVGTSERQLGMNLVPTKSHSNYMGTTVYHGPNVIGLWWPVTNSGLRLTARPLPFQFTTTKRALITTVDHPAREALLPPMLSSLHPRLFRGVTPDRHDGESHVTHTENADLHIPATRVGK